MLLHRWCVGMRSGIRESYVLCLISLSAAFFLASLPLDFACEILLGEDEQALHGEMGRDVGDFGEIACDELCVTTGGDDGDGLLHFLLELKKNFFDETAVAKNRAGEHRFMCRFPNGLCGLGELDER